MHEQNLLLSSMYLLLFMETCHSMIGEHESCLSKADASGSAPMSNSSVSGSSISHTDVYKEIYPGFRIKAQYEERMASAPSLQDFERLLAEASFEDPERMRCKGPNKIPAAWVLGAQTHVMNFIRSRPDLKISEVEATRLSRDIHKRISLRSQNSRLRGVNLVKHQARQEKKSVEEAVAAWKASRPSKGKEWARASPQFGCAGFDRRSNGVGY
ncbi:Protein spire-like protein 2 [Frankliniella fusca]|uniref:Protein spire-like protein 2 n=1 Tax=Frankliniella fusca TaxID=407009 RepID=A0AAE1LK01_9NEOP|nr:Protein spire-like protein 2 [Frankliniella fusca]